MVAQTRYYSHVVPGTGTILVGPDRAWVVLFRIVPGLAHRVSAKWPSIVTIGVDDVWPGVMEHRDIVRRGGGRLAGGVEVLEASHCVEPSRDGLAGCLAREA
jgi:hypothetical protein